MTLEKGDLQPTLDLTLLFPVHGARDICLTPLHNVGVQCCRRFRRCVDGLDGLGVALDSDCYGKNYAIQMMSRYLVGVVVMA